MFFYFIKKKRLLDQKRLTVGGGTKVGKKYCYLQCLFSLILSEKGRMNQFIFIKMNDIEEKNVLVQYKLLTSTYIRRTAQIVFNFFENYKMLIYNKYLNNTQINNKIIVCAKFKINIRVEVLFAIFIWVSSIIRKTIKIFKKMTPLLTYRHWSFLSRSTRCVLGAFEANFQIEMVYTGNRIRIIILKPIHFHS